MPLTLIPRKGTDNWYLRGSVRGQPVYETTGTANKELAEAIRIKREAQILEESVLGPRVSRTFREAAVGYIESVNPGRSQIEAVVGHQRQDGTLSPSLVQDFGPLLCSRIDQAAVDKVIRRRFAGRSPATVQRSFLMPLTAVLNWAAKGQRKWCDVPTFERPAGTISRGRTRWASEEEADRLLEACSPHLWRLVLFLVLSGARVGEALSLRWDDVDLGANWAIFRNTKRNKRTGRSEGEDRGVPLHSQVVAMLANLARPKSGEGFVFLTPVGLPYAERDGGGHIKTAWRLTCARAGIADLRVHDLRHTFATWLLVKRIPADIREEIMGHRSQRMSSRYAHVPVPELVQAVQVLSTCAKSVQSARPYPGKRLLDQGVA
ncbi:MAG TPA: site-specific integrase [Xanthobacteraceae bacterium]|nr:site-specific integrase [Xanthobacteraceae bacterium]